MNIYYALVNTIHIHILPMRSAGMCMYCLNSFTTRNGSRRHCPLKTDPPSKKLVHVVPNDVVIMSCMSRCNMLSSQPTHNPLVPEGYTAPNPKNFGTEKV